VEESIREGQDRFAARFEVVRYEDLLTDPDSGLRRLWASLGVETDIGAFHAEIERELNRNPEAEWHSTFKYDFLRQLPRGTHGGWTALFTPADQERFDKVAGNVLAAWGYRPSP